MTNNHLLVKNIGNLKGFSTDSSFIRPSNVADKAVNVMMYPDGTLATRRGYQCQVAEIGGLGTGTYHVTSDDSIGTVTIGLDGLLYKKLNKQIYLYYDGRSTGTITGASNANPCKITSIGHGLQTGAKIIIRNVNGMVELNNRTFTITFDDVDHFTLDGEDSSTYAAYVSGGDWVISFTENRYLIFTIFTDPRYLTATLGWSYGPWSMTPWGAPGGESITSQITINAAGQVNGDQVAVNTITLWFGHELEVNDVVIFNNYLGVAQQRKVTGITATSITVDGLPVTVKDLTFVSQFFDIPFRKGFDTIAPYLIQTFISTITDPVNGINGLQISINGDSSYPAAFLGLVEPTIIDHNTVFELDYFYWKAVNKTTTTTFLGALDPKFLSSPDFENASFATVDDVIYIANGIDMPQKYDDQTVYLVGMTQGVRPTVASAGAGKLANGTYYYAITYEQVDNIGHHVEGVISDKFQFVLTGGPLNATVTATNILQNSGYNTNCATVAAAAFATSYGPDVDGFYYDLVTVNDPHTLKVGDTAYYTDTKVAIKNVASAAPENTFTVNNPHGVQVGDVVTFLEMTTGDTQVRTVTEITASTIKVDGRPIRVDNLQDFSANKESLVFGDVAIANGNQSQVNIINVAVGYTIQINDIVSFVDTEGRTQRRTVTGIGAGTITISGIPVDILDKTLITSEVLRTNAINIRRETNSPPYLLKDSPISNNLRINIWRTQRDGSILKLLTTIPNNSFTITQTFTDSIIAGPKTSGISAATQAIPCKITSVSHGLNTDDQIGISGVLGMTQLNGRNYTITYVDADNFTLNGIDSTLYTAYISGGSWTKIFDANSQLGVDFPDPIRLPNPPPISKYLLSFGNQLLYAGGKIGDQTNDDNVFFSEGNEPENVPAATNFFTVPSQEEPITGMGASGTSLIITKGRSLYAVSGNLLTSQFQLVPISPGTNIGCVAHATIQSVGSLLYFLHTNGVYAISENQLYPTDAFGNPVAISTPIELLFKEVNFIPQTRYVLKRAVAHNYAKDDQYLLFLPCEDSQSTYPGANLNSIILCYDYKNKNWFVWNNMNAAGGIFSVRDDLYFQERRNVALSANLYKQHRFYRLIDHADHTSVQRVEWRSSWEDFNMPEVRKKFSHCMLLIDRISDLQQFNSPQMYFSSYLDRINDRQNTIAHITTVNNNNNSGWAQSAWSYSQWAGYQDTFARINLKGGTVAKSIQVGFQMIGINTDFRLAGFQLEAIPENRKSFVR